MTTTTRRSLARHSAVMASGSFVSRILGVVRQAMIMTIFGRSVAGDAWSIANTLPNTIYLLLAGGVLNAVLVPQITKAAEQKDGGREYVDRLLTVAVLGMAVITAVCVPLAPWLVRLFASKDFPSEGFGLAVSFSLICLPAIFFYGLYAIFGQVLNAREKFGWYMWSTVLCNIVWIVGLGAFLARYGRHLGRPDAFTPPMIWLIGGSLTVGVAAQALILIVPLWRTGFRYRPRFGLRGVGLRSASRVAGWTFAALVVSQVGLVIQSRILTSIDQGDTGKLAYDSAFMLFMTPHGLITVSIVTALFTSMSKAAARGDRPGVGGDVAHGLRVLGATIVPVAAGCLALGTALSTTIFIGSTIETSTAIGYVMMAMVVGLPAFAVFYIAQRAFYAFEDAKTPFWLQVVNTAIFVAIAWGCFSVSSEYRAVSVALAQAASNVVAAVVGVAWLRSRLGTLRLAIPVRTWVRALVASLPAAAAAAGLALLSRRYLPVLLPGPTDGQWAAAFLALVVGGGVFGAMYLAAAHRMRIRELDEFLAPIARRLRGVVRRGGPAA